MLCRGSQKYWRSHGDLYLYCNHFKIVLKLNVTHSRVRQSNMQQPVASEAGRTTKSDFVFVGQQTVFKRRFNTLENYVRRKFLL